MSRRTSGSWCNSFTGCAGKDIWCYTGYTQDVDLVPGGKVYTEVTEEMLSYIDRLVDGEFVEEKKDVTLKFRGSQNQRILRKKESGGWEVDPAYRP